MDIIFKIQQDTSKSRLAAERHMPGSRYTQSNSSSPSITLDVELL